MVNIINKNIEKTHLKEKIELYNLDYEILLKSKIKEQADIIYIDPPYKSDFAIKAVNIILENKLINEDSTIIIETDEEEKILRELEKIEIKITDKRKYGRAILIFLKIGKG